MKHLDLQKINSEIETIVANGVINGEEIDVTAANLMRYLNPLFLLIDDHKSYAEKQIRLHLERAAENLKDNGYVTSERILSSITSLPIILE